MTEEQIEGLVLDVINEFLRQLPDRGARRVAVTMLMTTGFFVLRMGGDKEFLRGWLDAATRDLAVDGSALGLRRTH